MISNKILVKDLSPKINQQILNGSFIKFKPIEIELFDDNLSGSKLAKIRFDSEKTALEAFNEMNGKELLKKQIKIEVLNEQDQMQKDTQAESSKLFDRDSIGELIFPLAYGKHPTFAPKITGMVIDSILNHSNYLSELNQILNSEDILIELIESAYSKLNETH